MTDLAGISIEERLAHFRTGFEAVRDEMSRVIVGQSDAIEQLLVAVFSGGHVLLTGVPGLGRTLLVRTLAKVLGLDTRRIQFTSDLLPSDVVGTEVLEKDASGGRHFRFFKGPVFTHLLLADEINRSPARTQAALLEAMHERQVTLGGVTHRLPRPFLVVATRNNLETEGVWRMSEAQIDRFMVSVELDYPDEADEIELLRRTTSTEQAAPRTVLDADAVLDLSRTATAVPVVPTVKEYALDIVRFSRPCDDAPEEIATAVRLGASPRAGQAMLRGAKVLAIIRGRAYVSTDDIRTMAYPVMEHRLMLDFRAASRGLSPRDVTDDLIRIAESRRVPPDAYRSRTRLVLKPFAQTGEEPCP